MGEEERLQKIIAAAGLASRRHAEELIQQGRVTVNGRIVTRLGAKADPQRDHIKVDGKLIHGLPQKLYFLLNKPRQVISSVSDPEGRVKVTDLIDTSRRIYPVGRLDYNTEGVILLTNDGDFAKIVTTAGRHMPKVYHVKVRSTPEEQELIRLRKGLRRSRVAGPCRIIPIEETNWFEVTLTQGKTDRGDVQSIGRSPKLSRVRISFLMTELAVRQYRRLTLKVERILRIGRRMGSNNAAGGLFML